MRIEKRINKRRKFGYYIRVSDNNTHETVGYLSDISPAGFKLECPKILPVNQDYTLRLEMTSEISNQPYIAFVARAIWSEPDPITPNEYIEGFHIVSISPVDREIFNRVAEKYGKPES
jgi:hypothetical protein